MVKKYFIYQMQKYTNKSYRQNIFCIFFTFTSQTQAIISFMRLEYTQITFLLFIIIYIQNTAIEIKYQSILNQ